MFFVTCWKKFCNTVQRFLKTCREPECSEFCCEWKYYCHWTNIFNLAFFSQKLQVIKLNSRRRAILNKVMFPVSLIIFSHNKFPILWSVKTGQNCKSLSQILINKIMHILLLFITMFVLWSQYVFQSFKI